MEPTSEKLVTVFGGSGFIGRALVTALAKDGWTVRIAVRRPAAASSMQRLGEPGTISAVEGNVRDQTSVANAIKGASAVINLVGILAEQGDQSFQALQADGAKRVADAAREHGVKRFVQMSAIGAAADSPSVYARTKAAGEAAALEAFADAVIVRPSIVFGPGDKFFNRFASMAKLSPALPVIGPDTRFQPVFVGDVAAFTLAAANGLVPGGTAYELGGPDIETFRALLELMLRYTGQKRMVVAVPKPIARIQAKVFSVLPNPPVTDDQITLLQRDNVVSESAIAEGRTLAAAHIDAQSLDAILPTYLGAGAAKAG